MSNKNWTSFNEFIKEANIHCNWLVLRNFEYLPDDFFGNDTDVDVLCENVEQFTTKMGLTKRSYGVAAYEANIAGIKVPFDVRFLGDGYYDKLWQYKMLKTKTYTAEGVPRLSDEHYFYSLIYHAKIQKKLVKSVYRERFFNLATVLQIANYYTVEKIDDDKYVASLLDNFMRENYFSFSKPIDINIPCNERFFMYLSCYVTQRGPVYSCRVSPLTPCIKFIPKIIRKSIPVKLKKLIEEMF